MMSWTCPDGADRAGRGAPGRTGLAGVQVPLRARALAGDQSANAVRRLWSVDCGGDRTSDLRTGSRRRSGRSGRYSALSTRAVGVRAAWRPGSTATRLESTSAPTATRTIGTAGTV